MLALHFALPLGQWNAGASRWLGLPFAVGGTALVLVGQGRFRGVTTLRPYEEPRVLVRDGLHRAINGRPNRLWRARVIGVTAIPQQRPPTRRLLGGNLRPERRRSPAVNERSSVPGHESAGPITVRLIASGAKRLRGPGFNSGFGLYRWPIRKR